MAWALPERAVLGIFAIRPGPEPGGATLARDFGPERSAAIREAMLLDVLDTWSSESVLSPGGRRVLVYAPSEAGSWFDARVPAAFALRPQDGDNLRDRTVEFFGGEFADGASKVVLIGSDAPTLDPSIVVSAFLCLEGRDVVLGPSDDGGVYLVGCRGEAPPIFDGIDRDAPIVLAEAVDRLNSTGLTLAVLPPWYVVNRPEAWRTLSGHLRALRRAGVNPGLPRVEAWAEETRPRAAT